MIIFVGKLQFEPSRMKKFIIFSIEMLLISMLSVSCVSNNGWTKQELQLIHSASLSRMDVLTIDNPDDSLILRKVSRDLTRRDVESVEFAYLAASMIETVNNSDNPGVGIAAPQVGISVNMIVVQRVDKAGAPFEVYVNPKIISRNSESVPSSEGCLSVPEYRMEIPRSKDITISYRHPITYDEVIEEIYGFPAIIFQHEIDHLSGILYFDRYTESSTFLDSEE